MGCSMSDQHNRFLQRLADSEAARFAVAQHLCRKGSLIEIPPLRFAPTAADAEHYRDEGDLFLVTRKRIEVKGLSINFTGRDDWPFAYVFVTSKTVAEREGRPVAAYISISADLKHAVVIKGSTSGLWFSVDKSNRNTGNVERYLACPLSHVEFITIGKHGVDSPVDP